MIDQIIAFNKIFVERKGYEQYLTDKYLARDVVEQAQMVKYAEVERLLKRFYVQKVDYLYNRVWALICLHQWWVERMNKC